MNRGVLVCLLLGLAVCSCSLVSRQKAPIPIDDNQPPEEELPENETDETVDTLKRLKNLKNLYSDLLRRSDDTRKMVDDIPPSPKRRKRTSDTEVDAHHECCDVSRTLRIPGYPGNDGAEGETGFPGERGQMGDPGDMGPPGLRGEPGERGSPGEKGITGGIGDPGLDGPAGINGEDGPPGDQGMKGDPDNQGTTHSSYIRWGRKDCPGDAEIVYEGYAAGSAYNEKGGGADYLCLPKNPQYITESPEITASWRARIHGSEYEIVDFAPYSGMDNGDVPCAVCLITGRSSVLMQPARYTCPNGWTREYMGYIMAAHHEYYRTKWVCVDENAELTTQESTRNLDGALFYPVVANCHNSITGLPCDSYTAGNELTCSVCTS